MNFIHFAFLCYLATATGLMVSTKVQEGIERKPIQRLKLSSSAGGKRTEAKSKIVWLLGDSNSWLAVIDFCTQAKVNITGVQIFKIWDRLYCTHGGLTMIYSFHPGASKPPYFEHPNHGPFEHTTQEMVTSELQDIRQTFGKPPDVIVVNSDHWDVSTWWVQLGGPRTWSVPHERVNFWCHQTVPHFLDFVQDLVPTAHVALRSPPPCRNDKRLPMFYALSETIDEMASCLRKSAHHGKVSGATESKYRFIDWYHIVDEKVQSLGGNFTQWYRDETHPGPNLTQLEVSRMLDWVKET